MSRFSKRGQEVFGISYGTIFAIIIIVVTIAVGIYVINAFMSWNECRQLGTFYDHLQTEIDNAWASDRYCDQFPKQNNPQQLPKSVQYVCYGDLTSGGSADPNTRSIKDKLKATPGIKSDRNIFFYPPEKTCKSLASNKLQHLSFQENKFVCVPVSKGKAAPIWLSHDVSSQSLVNLGTANQGLCPS